MRETRKLNWQAQVVFKYGYTWLYFTALETGFSLVYAMIIDQENLTANKNSVENNDNREQKTRRT